MRNPRPPLPAELLGRVQAQLDAADAEARRPAPRAPATLWRVFVPTAAIVAVAAFLAGDPHPCRPRESPVVMDSIVKHQRNLPLEITGAPEVVRSWFDGKVPFAVRAPRLDPIAELRGGRLVSLGNREAAYLIYEVRGEVNGRRVSVFVFDAHDLPLMAPRRQLVGRHEVYLEGSRGYHVALLRDNDVGYAFTGTLDEPDLIRLVSAALGGQ